MQKDRWGEVLLALPWYWYYIQAGWVGGECCSKLLLQQGAQCRIHLTLQLPLIPGSLLGI